MGLIAEEAAASLLSNRTLNRLAQACAPDILPPLEPAEKVRIIGASLGSVSMKLVNAKASDPTRLISELWGDPKASYTHKFPVAGEYQGTLQLDIPGRQIDTLNVLTNGEVVYSAANLHGLTSVVFPITIETPGDTLLSFQGNTIPFDNALTFEYVGLELEGPLNPGGTAEAQLACATELVEHFAPRAYRRPLTPAQQSSLLSLYTAGVQKGDPALGLTTLLQAILTSPYFLYLVEVGTPVAETPGVHRLTHWEVAARLSYAICEQPPDETLLNAAANAELDSSAQVETQARRLFELPCAHETISHFFDQWLWLNRLPLLVKDTSVFPEFTVDVASGMAAETHRFIREMVWQQGASLNTLLTSNRVWPDPRSAFVYGLENVVAQTETTWPDARAGLLMHSGVLAVSAGPRESSPVSRGVYILERILCNDLPSPPADVTIPPLPADPGGTTRERLAAHTKNDSCRVCHEQIDPVGYLLEGFDAIGRHRISEHGVPVDTTGAVPALGEGYAQLDSATDLIRALAEAPQTTACFSRHWLRFALGRTADEGDAVEIALVAASVQSGSLREGLIRLLASPSFLHRRERSPL
jgi:hypothetical protein